MRKITLDIPDALDTEIAQYLLCSGLENRDKGRMMLFAVEEMMKEDAPEKLKNRCEHAKAQIRAKAKAKWQERKQ
jgi:hypothetical protein